MAVMRRMAFIALLGAACTAPAPVRSHSPVPEVSDPAPHASVWPAAGLPAVHLEDRDGDGAFFEKCAGEREDFDGFEDDDGCPDRDDDADGFLDAADQCPRAAEDGVSSRGGDPRDGCPR